MRFDHSVEQNVVVFRLSGKIMGGDDSDKFHSTIKDYISRKMANVVLDLSGVEWVNSVGLGMLIAGQVSVRNAGGRLVLANIDSIENILMITQLIRVFEHFDTTAEALATFK